MPKSIRGGMPEFKPGALHSGSSTGPVGTKRSQAVASALSEQRQRGRRLAGSHDGLYVTSHHSGAKTKG